MARLSISLNNTSPTLRRLRAPSSNLSQQRIHSCCHQIGSTKTFLETDLIQATLSQLRAAAADLHSEVVTAPTATERALSSQHQDGPRLQRPLLHLTRSETARICRSLNLPIWVDNSNQDLHLARNRIRHQVMPVLGGFTPGVINALLNSVIVCPTCGKLRSS